MKALQGKPLGILIALVLINGIFSFLSGNYFSLTTWGGILAATAELGIVVLGITPLMIAGEFDLSVGANFALSGILFALLLPITNDRIALLCALFLGATIGWLNGFITVKAKISSFIATLSMLLVCRGIALLITDGFPVIYNHNTSVMLLLSGSLYHNLLSSSLWWLALGSFCIYLISSTKTGNHIRAVGSNCRIAYALGINTQTIKLTCFTLSGLLSALAGCVQFSHVNSIAATAGEQYELYAIAAAVLGGNALTGGKGSVLGAMLSTLLLLCIDTGLVQSGFSTYWYRTLVGIILLSTVGCNLRVERWMQGKV